VNVLERALDRLVLGEQPPEDLPAIATEASVAGIDSPSLTELAGTSPSDYQDARDLFLRAAEELGIAMPTAQDARWRMVRAVALDMVNGRLTPLEASRRIWWEGWEELGRPDELSPFVALATGWEEDLSGRDLCEREMLDAARRLLAESA